MTILTNKTIPKFWECPFCKKINQTGASAEEILIENFKYLEYCAHCGYIHFWKLQLTEDFKKKVVRMLLHN